MTGIPGPVLAVAGLLLTGCGLRDCLPEPPSDATPPNVRIVIAYTDPQTGREVSREAGGSDAALELDADASTPVRIDYAAADPEGLRRVHLGVTIQQTVAVGVQHRAVDIDPVDASCPQPDLRGTWSVRGRRAGETLAIGLVAQNWTGGISTMPGHVVHLRSARAR